MPTYCIIGWAETPLFLPRSRAQNSGLEYRSVALLGHFTVIEPHTFVDCMQPVPGQYKKPGEVLIGVDVGLLQMHLMHPFVIGQISFHGWLSTAPFRNYGRPHPKLVLPPHLTFACNFSASRNSLSTKTQPNEIRHASIQLQREEDTADIARAFAHEKL